MKLTLRDLEFYSDTISMPTIIFISFSDKTELVTHSEASVIEINETFAPVEVKSSDGKVNFLYSLQLGDFEKEGYKIKDFQILNPTNNSMFCSFTDTRKFLSTYIKFSLRGNTLINESKILTCIF